MKKFLEMLTEEMQQAFTAAGYDGSLRKACRQQSIFRSGGSSPRIFEPEGQRGIFAHLFTGHGSK